MKVLLLILTLPLSSLIQQMTNEWYFPYFPQKTGFDISCKLSSENTNVQWPKGANQYITNGLATYELFHRECSVFSR